MPPGMARQPGPPSVGSVTQPQPRQGNEFAARAMITQVIKVLGAAGNNLPMGSPEHIAVIDAQKALAKHFGQNAPPESTQQQANITQAREAQMEGAPPQVQRLAGGGGGAPMMPPGGPAV